MIQTWHQTSHHIYIYICHIHYYIPFLYSHKLLATTKQQCTNQHYPHHHAVPGICTYQPGTLPGTYHVQYYRYDLLLVLQYMTALLPKIVTTRHYQPVASALPRCVLCPPRRRTASCRFIVPPSLTDFPKLLSKNPSFLRYDNIGFFFF